MGSPNWNKMKKSIKDYKEKRQSLVESQDEGDQLFFNYDITSHAQKKNGLSFIQKFVLICMGIIQRKRKGVSEDIRRCWQ